MDDHLPETGVQKTPLIVVSGLPRSGTSLMMAVLQAGGIPLLHDQLRPPDIHNPRGYFEYQPVRRLEQDSSWLGQHRGQAVKIIYRLLCFIPTTVPAKIIFMERDMVEVLSSQQAMLAEGSPKIEWTRIFQAELDKILSWLGRQPHLQVLRVSFAEFLTRPQSQSERISQFLGLSLDAGEMARMVDLNLYRRRRP